MRKEYKAIYWLTLAAIVAFGILAEIFPTLDGIAASGSATEFYCQYALTAITLLDVYLALRLIKKNPVLRILLLGIPALLDILAYHAFMTASFGYMAIMCLIGFAFVYPAKNGGDNNNQ